ncbi:conserved hypothetical protein [Beggiatoa sp. PS]|nr:conserved hypothetical protein [Beggiatoa sp. PS]
MPVVPFSLIYHGFLKKKSRDVKRKVTHLLNVVELFFKQVAPQLMTKHYGWSIHIEPDSGDYFIDPDSDICFQKARQKHPTAMLMEMCLNETGACGRI